MAKYRYIDLARTIAMFGVILFHILVCFSRNLYWFIYADYENDVATYLCNILNFTLVPTFVFCSGFLFQSSMQNKKISTSVAIFKRGKKLLLPFFIYGLLWLVPIYTLLDIPVNGRPKGTSLIDGYKSMLIGQFCDLTWFLLMLFWVTIIWILLRALLKKERFIIGIIVAVGLYFASHYLLANVNYYKINQIDIYIIIFFAGASFFWVADKINTLPVSVLMLISVVGTAVCSIFASYTAVDYRLYFVMAIVMPFLVVILSMGLCKLRLHSHIENTGIYKWLLKHNMDIYLMQAPGIYLSFWLCYSLVGQNFALCTIVSYIFAIVIDFVLVIILTYIIQTSHLNKCKA